MRKFFHILSQTGTETGFFGTFTISQALSVLTVIAGIAILIAWLIRNKGFSALDSAPPRVNKMRLHTPLLQFGIWIVLVSLTGYLIRKRFGDPLPPQGQLALYIGMLAVQIGMIFSILVVAFSNFHLRFKGFGLNPRTLPKDIGWAIVNYIAAMPLVLFSIWIIVSIGKQFVTGDFEFPKNESLEELMQFQTGLKIVVIFSLAVVVPILEELLFRGLIQSTLRTHLHSPWLAIFLTSLIFVVMHPNWQHWLPLMALSVCMGYAYEKSGSILRSITIHILFNSISIVGALTQVQAA
jgi:membrane protease YdiL (CAAX protease family)